MLIDKIVTIVNDTTWLIKSTIYRVKTELFVLRMLNNLQ